MIWGSLSCATSVIRKACARFPGSELPAVTPLSRIHRLRALLRLCPWRAGFKYVRMRFNLPKKSLENPSLLVFYATQHRSKSCPSCVLRHPASFKILPFLCFTPLKKSANQKTQEGEAKSWAQKSLQNHGFSTWIPPLLVFYANRNRPRTVKHKKGKKF